jgi:phytol kinase
MIFIPITINTLGDGLAEPVGVKWGKHKYTTRSLYYNGKWWSGSFVRSYEGSSMVWLSTWLILGILYDLFTTPQFIFLMVLMPPAMTLTEAISPHTNDGPFLAIIGCSIVAFALFLL